MIVVAFLEITQNTCIKFLQRITLMITFFVFFLIVLKNSKTQFFSERPVSYFKQSYFLTNLQGWYEEQLCNRKFWLFQRNINSTWSKLNCSILVHKIYIYKKYIIVLSRTKLCKSSQATQLEYILFCIVNFKNSWFLLIKI